jgi:Ion channel
MIGVFSGIIAYLGPRFEEIRIGRIPRKASTSSNESSRGRVEEHNVEKQATSYAQIWKYFRVVSVPMIGLLAGYLLTMLIFAGYFAAVYRNQPSGSFSGLPENAAFWDFIYFSLMTISTVGASDIRPEVWQAKLLVAVEAAVAMVWTVVILAAIIAYLEPRFREIRGK